MSIAARLIQLVELLQISKTQAAREMQTSTTTLQRLKHESINYPSSELLYNWKMSRPEINLNWVITGVGDPLGGMEEDISLRRLAQLEPETMVLRIQACEDMVSILKRALDDKQKVIESLEAQIELLR